MTLSKEPMVARLFKMPKSLSDALGLYASKHNRSDSEVVRDAIADYLGIQNPTIHGNKKYANDQDRINARRERQRNSRKLSKELLRQWLASSRQEAD